MYRLFLIAAFVGVGWLAIPVRGLLPSPNWISIPYVSSIQGMPLYQSFMSSTPTNEGGEPMIAASTNSPFLRFRFAENGVCVDPPSFCCLEEMDENATATTIANGIPDNTRKVLQAKRFTMRNVPGEGDCMFLAVALAALTSVGLGGNDALLRAISRETRAVVSQILQSPTGTLWIDANQPKVSARALLASATQKEGYRSTEEYLRILEMEGRMGGLYGGGPELAVLANLLRRPISVYELPTATSTIDWSENGCCPILCKGVFGAGIFSDPLDSDSAVLEAVQQHPGAYSWHLHILVVDVPPQEKHACVLLPQPVAGQ